jgi:hypothetical protein
MACQVVHGFRKSDQNEKLHRGEPHSRHEARSQVLQQPEHSVLTLIGAIIDITLNSDKGVFG